MPTLDQIDPQWSRERGIFETDEQYAERMKKLDERAALLDRFITPAPEPKEGA